MFVKKRKDSTDPRLRSLLQKAVRRGYSGVVESTARRLDAARDKAWLRSRAVVITFEESWPLAQQLSITTQFDSRLAAFLRVTSAEKQKDAASLGALAYAFDEGDQSILEAVPDRWALRTVSEALRRPLAFFEWAQANCKSPAALQVVDAARRYLAAATWGWDKACIIAGAFLATTAGVPETRKASNAEGAFPYWVALDKHTPQGKEVLHEIARAHSISYRHLIWSGFYFESAKVNALAESPWWSAEKAWRLTRAGLAPDAAEQLWERVRAVIAERLQPEAEELRKVVENHSAGEGSLF